MFISKTIFMAQLKQGINGPASGKIGPTVHYVMYGKHFVRSLPDIRNYKQTPNRQKQQQRMALVQAFLQPFKELIRLSFATIAVGNAPYHVAKSYNLRHAIKGDTYPEQTIDFNNTYLSAGPIELPDNYTVQRSDDGLLFNWIGKNGRSNDTLLLIVYYPEWNSVNYQFTGVKRSKESFLWDVDLAADDMHVWMAFRSRDETQMSNSMYLGKV